MFAFLRKIQQRPERERRMVALWTAFWITAFVFVIWLVSLFAHLDQMASPVDAKISKEVSPLSGSKEIFSSLFTSLKDLF